jgi:hypothetical protein
MRWRVILKQVQMERRAGLVPVGARELPKVQVEEQTEEPVVVESSSQNTSTTSIENSQEERPKEDDDVQELLQMFKSSVSVEEPTSTPSSQSASPATSASASTSTVNPTTPPLPTIPESMKSKLKKELQPPAAPQVPLFSKLHQQTALKRALLVDLDRKSLNPSLDAKVPDEPLDLKVLLEDQEWKWLPQSVRKAKLRQRKKAIRGAGGQAQAEAPATPVEEDASVVA